MAKLGQKVHFHTVHGDALGFVVGHDPQSSNSDDDTELVVFPGHATKNGDTGLTADVNRVPSHENDQAGGFTPC